MEAQIAVVASLAPRRRAWCVWVYTVGKSAAHAMWFPSLLSFPVSVCHHAPYRFYLFVFGSYGKNNVRNGPAWYGHSCDIPSARSLHRKRTRRQRARTTEVVGGAGRIQPSWLSGGEGARVAGAANGGAFAGSGGGWREGAFGGVSTCQGPEDNGQCSAPPVVGAFAGNGVRVHLCLHSAAQWE